MAKDIFQRDVDLGQPLAADSTRLIFPNIGDADMLMQDVQFSYQQRVSRLWEVGSPKTFFFAGRTEGQITATRIVGNKASSDSFIAQFGDVCNMAQNHLTLLLQAGCEGVENRGQLMASGVVINSVQYSIQAQEAIIRESLGMMFARMEKA